MGGHTPLRTTAPQDRWRQRAPVAAQPEPALLRHSRSENMCNRGVQCQNRLALRADRSPRLTGELGGQVFRVHRQHLLVSPHDLRTDVESLPQERTVRVQRRSSGNEGVPGVQRPARHLRRGAPTSRRRRQCGEQSTRRAGILGAVAGLLLHGVRAVRVRPRIDRMGVG